MDILVSRIFCLLDIRDAAVLRQFSNFELTWLLSLAFTRVNKYYFTMTDKFTAAAATASRLFTVPKSPTATVTEKEKEN